MKITIEDTKPIIKNIFTIIVKDEKGKVLNVYSTNGLCSQERILNESVELFGTSIASILELICQYGILGGKLPASNEEIRKLFATLKKQ